MSPKLPKGNTPLFMVWHRFRPRTRSRIRMGRARSGPRTVSVAQYRQLAKAQAKRRSVGGKKRRSSRLARGRRPRRTTKRILRKRNRKDDSISATFRFKNGFLLPVAGGLQLDNMPAVPNAIRNPGLVVLAGSTGSTLTAQGELVQSGLIGQYTFNFTRQLGMLPGGIFSSFRYAKFSRGAHVIRRIDTGANIGMVTGSGLTGAPVNFGTRPTLLRVYYKYLSPLETTASKWSFERLRADPFVKVRSLRAGRKLTWKFLPLCQRGGCTVHTVTRKGIPSGALSSMGTTEENRNVILTLPGKFTRLKTFPLGAFFSLDNSNYDAAWTDGAGPSQTGSSVGNGAGALYASQILGRTIICAFDWDGVDGFQINLPGALGNPYTYTSVAAPVISRSEYCSVRLSGMMRTFYATVGQILTQGEYPLGYSGDVQQPTVELVSAPHISVSHYPPLGANATVPSINRGTNEWDITTVPMQSQAFIVPQIPI